MGQDLPPDHLRVDDDMAGMARIKGPGLQAHDISMKNAQPDPRPAPPGRVLSAAFEPDAVNAVAGPVHVLAPRPFQAEDTVKTVAGQRALDGIRENDRPARARRRDSKGMTRHPRRWAGPGLREQVQFMAAFAKRGQ